MISIGRNRTGLTLLLSPVSQNLHRLVYAQCGSLYAQVGIPVYPESAQLSAGVAWITGNRKLRWRISIYAVFLTMDIGRYRITTTESGAATSETQTKAG